MEQILIGLDSLIELIRNGGSFTTGVNIVNSSGAVVIGKDLRLEKPKLLLALKKSGMENMPVAISNLYEILDNYGKRCSKPTIALEPDDIQRDTHVNAQPSSLTHQSYVEDKIREINVVKKEAYIKYTAAKKNIKKVLTDITSQGGEFDVNLVKSTIDDIFKFLVNRETAFSYLTREIFDYDDYIYNHSVNTCTIATAILNRFNDNMAKEDKTLIADFHTPRGGTALLTPKGNYNMRALQTMAVGFFLHDVGKVLIPDNVLNKPGRLTDEEFEIVKSHSYEKGPLILEKNNLTQPVVKNIIRYHHAPIFHEEERCYPNDKPPEEIPPYVKICKLADIYDAMTSKRSYKEAVNPVVVVSGIYRKYLKEDYLLRHILHAFIKVVGVYPPGSIVYLINGKMAYVVDSQGPIVVPFTDEKGVPVNTMQEALDLGKKREIPKSCQVNRLKPVVSPTHVYKILPDFLKDSVFIENASAS